MDWNDILIHATVAFFGVTALSLLFDEWVSWRYFVVFNTVFWPTRELMQHKSLVHIFMSPQSLLEWTMPLIAGVLAVIFFKSAFEVERK